MAISKANIGQALHSVAGDHVTAVADDIFDETLGKYQSTTNNESLSGGVYNVTKLHPLQSGYYTLATAVAAVPSALRSLGMVITYQVGAESWETKQFTGALADWAVDSKWVDFGSGDSGISETTSEGYEWDDIMTGSGGFIRANNGELKENAGYAYSDYIECSDFTSVIVSGNAATSNSVAVAAFYDENKGFISAEPVISGTTQYNISVPSNAKYARFSANYGSSQSYSLSFTATRKITVKKYVDENLQELSSLMESSLEEIHTDYAKKTDLDDFVSEEELESNLYVQKETVRNGENVLTIGGYFIRATTSGTNIAGSAQSNNSYSCSDFIDCSGYKNIYVYNYEGITSVAVAAFYDENHDLLAENGIVTSIENQTDYACNVPSGAKYVRLSCKKLSVDSYSIKTVSISPLKDVVSELMENQGGESPVIPTSVGEVFLSPNGSDSNDGLTESTPVATISKALGIGTKTLVMLPGDYDNLDFRLDSFDRIIGYSKVRIVRYAVKITEATIASGYTRVYQAAIPSLNLSNYLYIYQHDIPDPATEILASERHPIHRNRVYRLPSTRMYKAASVAEIEETTDKLMWYVDGTTLYFSKTDGSDLDVNPVIIPGGGMSAANKKKYFEMHNIDFMYTHLELTNVCGVLDNVSVGMTSPVAGGFVLNYSKSSLLRNCEAYAVQHPNGGDGFNIQNSNTSVSDRSFVTYENCWAHDNRDDGESCHASSNSVHYGGVYEYNGNGITPASGANAQCYNVLVRRNGTYPWVFDDGGTGFSAQGEGAHCQCVGCISQNNKKGYKTSGTAKNCTFDAINCVSDNDNQDYDTDVNKINCLTL